MRILELETDTGEHGFYVLERGGMHGLEEDVPGAQAANNRNQDSA